MSHVVTGPSQHLNTLASIIIRLAVRHRRMFAYACLYTDVCFGTHMSIYVIDDTKAHDSKD